MGERHVVKRVILINRISNVEVIHLKALKVASINHR